ncbi:DUF3080 family protein [Endozoicomonas numazuensis]|uniref:DUF3080 domain-containing protein n=1 Tax=Endozoicomonas numazuensis TaxID=1137799 RepID=A0A081NFJ3_9GAMM|nr:DUF3080 family protein [Endozoicomonas numazuensis]KEQ17216.1 hypothetical protein GZ78_15400 [Endozoicomonas numazuensis]
MTLKATIHSLLFVLLLTLTGCGYRSTPEYQLEEYESRISTVTEVSLPSPTISFPELPSLRKRQYPLPDIRLKALEALNLLECPKLTQLIAHRNNSLGKQMQPSQLLDYEKKLIVQLKDCIHYLQQQNKKPELRAKLETTLQQKESALPAAKWNMLLSNTELPGQLSGFQNLLPLQGDNGRQGTLEALKYLTSYLKGDRFSPPYDQQSLEMQLQQLTASHYSGQLLAAATAITNTLNRVSVMLENSHNICPQGRRTVTIERLNNVFRLFYVDSIQPYMSKVVSEGREWRSVMLSLLLELPAPPDKAMEDYLLAITDSDSDFSIWNQLDKAIIRHTQSWQTVLMQCQMQPGKKP